MSSIGGESADTTVCADQVGTCQNLYKVSDGNECAVAVQATRAQMRPPVANAENVVEQHPQPLAKLVFFINVAFGPDDLNRHPENVFEILFVRRPRAHQKVEHAEYVPRTTAQPEKADARGAERATVPIIPAHEPFQHGRNERLGRQETIVADNTTPKEYRR